MNPQVAAFGLIGVFALGLLAAGYAGHRVPLPVILVMIVVGAAVVVAPTFFSLIVQLMGNRPQFTDDERITCWILGGVMAMVGIIGAIVPVRQKPQ